MKFDAVNIDVDTNGCLICTPIYWSERQVARYAVPVFQSLGYSEVHKYEKDDSDVNVGDVIVKNDAEADIFYKVSLEAMIGKGEFTPTENDIAF